MYVCIHFNWAFSQHMHTYIQCTYVHTHIYPKYIINFSIMYIHNYVHSALQATPLPTLCAASSPTRWSGQGWLMLTLSSTSWGAMESLKESASAERDSPTACFMQSSDKGKRSKNHNYNLNLVHKPCFAYIYIITHGRKVIYCLQFCYCFPSILAKFSFFVENDLRAYVHVFYI